MTKYYIRTEKTGAFGTIYFNFQKCVPPIRWRVCTHIQVDIHAWIAANKSAASWNKFANSETGKPIVEKLQLMQHTLEELFNDGKLQSNADKALVDEVVMAIVNADAVEKEAEIEQAKVEQKENFKSHILNFYDIFVEGIKSGVIRHGNNKIYGKTTIESWESFRKYAYGYCSKKDKFDDIDKSYADGFSSYLEKCGLMPTTCNKYIICFRKLCNLAAEYGINHNATSLRVWKEREVREKEKRAEVYLTDEELDAIYNYPLEGNEEHARDLFVLGCLSCQRFSDYSSLTRANFVTTVLGTPIIKLRQQKTGNIVEIPILDDRINEICQKYDFSFPKLDERHTNDFLLTAMKKIASVCPSLMEKHNTVLTMTELRKEQNFIKLRKLKNSGCKLKKEDYRVLRNLIEYAEEHNGQPLYERDSFGQAVKFKYELVTTHTARRSGVTNMYKTGLFDKREMMSISGHLTEAIFENYIKVSKSEQADRIAAKYLRAKMEKQNERANA